MTCFTGAIYDVVVDMRPQSPTRLQWFGIELRAGDDTSLFIPKGLAHGFQTIEDNALVHYQMSDVYVGESAAGVRYDDPTLGITWPLEPRNVAPKDRAFSLL